MTRYRVTYAPADQFFAPDPETRTGEVEGATAEDALVAAGEAARAAGEVILGMVPVDTADDGL